MIPFTLSEIAPLLNAKHLGNDSTIQSVVTDSRLLKFSNNSMFIALKGKKFDAHDFVKQAVTSGAEAILTNHQMALNVPQLIVKDTYRALDQIANWVRRNVRARIVAITGSSGKTSVREMATSILSQCGQVLANESNFNNNIGVSKTLLRLTQRHDFAVIELGANHFGEIAKMTTLVNPEVALINNISASHLSGFGSLSGVAQAKGEIFIGLKANGRGIFNSDSHDWLHWQSMLGHKPIWRFAIEPNEGVDFFARNIVMCNKGTCFILHTPYGKCCVRLSLLGKHNISNALAASALALSVGAKISALSSGLSQLKAIPGRLFPIVFGDGKLILDDSYNANVESMLVAIRVLSNIPGYRVMAVGDMAELGHKAPEYHQRIGEAIAVSNIDKVLSIGDLSHLICKMSKRGEHFKDKTALIARLLVLIKKKKTITILVKGSRNMAMEQVVHALVKEKESC